MSSAQDGKTPWWTLTVMKLLQNAVEEELSYKALLSKSSPGVGSTTTRTGELTSFWFFTMSHWRCCCFSLIFTAFRCVFYTLFVLPSYPLIIYSTNVWWIHLFIKYILYLLVPGLVLDVLEIAMKRTAESTVLFKETKRYIIMINAINGIAMVIGQNNWIRGGQATLEGCMGRAGSDTWSLRWGFPWHRVSTNGMGTR